jgi:hypothetical protein
MYKYLTCDLRVLVYVKEIKHSPPPPLYFHLF